MEEQQGRWSARKKTEAVLRLLRGETVDTLSRELNVTVEALSRWREAFVEAGIAGLKGRTNEDVRIAQLEKKVGQQAMLLELYEKKDRFVEQTRGSSSR